MEKRPAGERPLFSEDTDVRFVPHTRDATTQDYGKVIGVKLLAQHTTLVASA